MEQKKTKEIYCLIAGPSGRPQSSSMVNSSLIDDGYLLFYCIDISADSWMDRSSGMLTFTQAALEEASDEMVGEMKLQWIKIRELHLEAVDSVRPVIEITQDSDHRPGHRNYYKSGFRVLSAHSVIVSEDRA
ncbi:hypothetical protein CDAR_365341 [Caerostris darwini]|uniref:Pyridoxamine 5'-phosphate oxidase putative domain-containing protein n=1 Tax=Caerostris darwini TaxID=1538125 RepID=A0AAV4NP75_9ARAC|nr:hypothetical protein CDAR_365341 [Caerostris darwini]